MTSPDPDHEVVVLTGGTSGFGRIAARRLADRGATVAVVGRDRDRGRSLEAETADADGGVRFHRADLASLDAVRDLADTIDATYDGVDVLAHNAGLSSRDRRETPDGLERTVAVNHLAPYLLTHDLLDALRASAPARVVVTASRVHRRGSLDVEDLQFETDYDALDAYARSKLANVAFTLELADRLEATDREITANCFHPGFIPSTGLFRDAAPWVRWGLRALALVPGVGDSPETGADRLCRLATDPAFASRSGCYVSGDGVVDPAPAAADSGVRERLWRASADLVGVDPDWP